MEINNNPRVELRLTMLKGVEKDIEMLSNVKSLNLSSRLEREDEAIFAFMVRTVKRLENTEDLLTFMKKQAILVLEKDKAEILLFLENVKNKRDGTNNNSYSFSATGKKGEKQVRWVRIFENPFPFIGALLCAWLLWVNHLPTFGENYSVGQREGVLQKYSVKGYVFKTGEGELILPNFQFRGNAQTSRGGNEVFKFSNKDCKAFDGFVGHNVRVYYRQALHRPNSEGASNYQVDSLVVLE